MEKVLAALVLIFVFFGFTRTMSSTSKTMVVGTPESGPISIGPPREVNLRFDNSKNIFDVFVRVKGLNGITCIPGRGTGFVRVPLPAVGRSEYSIEYDWLSSKNRAIVRERHILTWLRGDPYPIVSFPALKEEP